LIRVHLRPIQLGVLMRDPRRGLGQRGEELAVAELARRGYTIRQRNWRCAAGEVDLVAEHDDWLVFVEVRARRGRALGAPEASITPAKRARMIQVAQSYLAELELGEVDWRIDVVAVELTRGGKLLRVDVYENAVTG
jgi:putative endonuclease